MSSKPITIEMIDLNQTSPYVTLPIAKDEWFAYLETAYKDGLKANTEWNNDPELVAAQGQTYFFEGNFGDELEAERVLGDYVGDDEKPTKMQRKADKLLTKLESDDYMVAPSNPEELFDWAVEFCNTKGHRNPIEVDISEGYFKVVVKPRTIKLKLKKLSDLPSSA